MKYFALIPITLLSLSACHQAELDRSRHEKDSLMLVVQERDTSINAFMSSFNDVERNLDSVAMKQHIISQSTDLHPEIKHDQKELINRQIIAINNLMEANRKELSELSRKLKGSTNKNIQLEKTIALMNIQLVHKYDELTALNDKLDAMNSQVIKLKTTIDTLSAQSAMKSQSINSKIVELHRAFYVVGKTKDLEKAKLIDKKGGLLGMGKTAQLNGNLNDNEFTCIDYTTTTSIEINSTKAKIISSHPSDSYTLDKDKKMIKNLMITDPEKFWSVSKYLVIAND